VKEVASEASSSQLVENESGFYGDVPFDQLESREEGVPQREKIEVHGVADGGEIAPGIVEDLAVVDRNAFEEEHNLNMEDEMDDEEEEDDDNMAT